MAEEEEPKEMTGKSRVLLSNVILRSSKTAGRAATAVMLLAGLVAAGNRPALAQRSSPSGRVDVEAYDIQADVNPRTQSINAVVQVRLTALDENISSATFELNNALNVSKVVDGSGRPVEASRSIQDYSIRLNFGAMLPKGKPTTLTFTYDGRLAGSEESPVFGIKFAALHDDFGYLLYPARWFPVSGYTADRYTADIKISVPAGYKVIGNGVDMPTERAAGDKVTYHSQFNNPAFPGSIAIVKGDSQRVTSQGVTTLFYLRSRKEAANAFGEEIARAMVYFSAAYGLPVASTLTIIETEDGASNGYSAPGVVFFSPRVLNLKPSQKLVANMVARQWWGNLISAATRNHIWIVNGVARYSEFMYLESLNGAASVEGEIRDSYIEALTVDNPPLIQASRLEDYSPEFWATTAGKGASVLNMLRWVIGDKPFQETLKSIPTNYAWKGITTEDFRKAAEKASGKQLDWFFLEWIESTGAPEFKMDYTVYRTTNGFRVMGKVSQDLDTFRMPVEVRIETEGNPEEKIFDVVGTSSEFLADAFGKPKKIVLDPNNHVLRMSNPVRVAVAIRKGEQFAEVGDYSEALKEYQKALDVNRNSSLAHYRVAEIFRLQQNWQSAANEFRESLNGDLDPKWTEVWAHINLGNIFDVTGQRERAVNEYNQAIRTKDNTQGAQEEAAKYLKTPYERPRTTQ
jgi:hypothetical protein